MREIKFRGKNDFNDEWYYGYLFLNKTEDGYCVGYLHDYADVIESTVGQFTGLKDSEGREIYEGDIIASCFADYKAVVEFRNGAFVAVTGPVDTYQALCGVLRLKGLRVIGNVHDNPELMERKP